MPSLSLARLRQNFDNINDHILPILVNIRITNEIYYEIGLKMVGIKNNKNREARVVALFAGFMRGSNLKFFKHFQWDICSASAVSFVYYHFASHTGSGANKTKLHTQYSNLSVNRQNFLAGFRLARPLL